MDAEKPLLTTILAGFTRPSWGFILIVMTILTVSWLHMTSTKVFPTVVSNDASTSCPADPMTCSWFYQSSPPRKMVMSIADFGGVGDGKTSNTGAFHRAVEYLKGYGDKGGSQLNIPEGRWVTGSFNLTSNFTLYLEKGAVILGSTDPKEWPIIEPLPSYGRGRERLGGRHISLIHGDYLNDVVVTGQNGTIDGQGRMWWELWWNRTLEHTRGHLVEFMNSHNILISNLTFLNSPFWTIHPVFCSNVVIKEVTILAPLNSPNTDGIDPDSSSHVCIEDCYIESGDDLVAVKSGWDQYGIAMSRPSSNIIVRRVSGTTPTCSGVGIGSEMSGGISNIVVEDLHVWDSAAGVRMKTDRGRGGYITNITITNMTLDRVKIPIRFSRGANDHPDEGWDSKALPVVKGVYINNVVGRGIGRAPVLDGLDGAPFEQICMINIQLDGIAPPAKWHCEFVAGDAIGVFPEPCPQLKSNDSSSWCSGLNTA
ncbi:probable polygalacturonase [Magnolia sinica]|uniref:probable polygalacturonase n=1 Tax=Magnolia sinica TaxID=86752 RepID=UPI0026580188|nr:probable polygalacturonase [Magnolia sinica]